MGEEEGGDKGLVGGYGVGGRRGDGERKRGIRGRGRRHEEDIGRRGERSKRSRGVGRENRGEWG